MRHNHRCKITEVSVVIPLWNKETYIYCAIQSVLRQTFKNFEIIVIDDGSTDSGPEIVRSIKDPRIRLVSQKNSGLSAARNRGISEAGSDLIAFLDADDEWLPTFLETVMRMHKKYPAAGVYATAYKLRMPQKHFEKAHMKNIPAYPFEGVLPNYFRASLGRNPVILPSATMIKKAVTNKLGGFDEGETTCEDYEFFSRTAFHYPIVWSSSVEAIYSRDVTGSNRMTHRMKKDIKAIETLIDGLSICSEDMREDVLNLIGKLYKFCAANYSRAGDRDNAVRCINESIKYSRGLLLVKLFIIRAVFFFNFKYSYLRNIIDKIKLKYRKYFYSTKR